MPSTSVGLHYCTNPIIVNSVGLHYTNPIMQHKLGGRVGLHYFINPIIVAVLWHLYYGASVGLHYYTNPIMAPAPLLSLLSSSNILYIPRFAKSY